MKVLVSGSRSADVEVGQFESACRALGSAMAERGDQLILLSDADDHAGKYVLGGYAEMANRHGTPLPNIRVSYGTLLDPENRVVHHERRKFSELRDEALFDDFRAEGEYPFNRVRYQARRRTNCDRRERWRKIDL